jgi:hypothetical protein
MRESSSYALRASEKQLKENSVGRGKRSERGIPLGVLNLRRENRGPSRSIWRRVCMRWLPQLNTPIGLRNDQPPENVARRTVHPPPPNYHDREVRVECKRACRRGVRGWCRPPSQPWHSPRARGQHARRCSVMPLRSARHERTTSIRVHRWRGRWSCPRCEPVRIFLFRTLVLRPAPQSAFRTVSSIAITPSRVGYAETSCIALVRIRCSFSEFLGDPCVSAVKRSSHPGTARQHQTCTASRKPRETPPDAYARASHPATESARLKPVNTRMDLALLRAASRLREERS